MCFLQIFIRIVLSVLNVHLRFVAILESIWLANIKKKFKGSQTQKINGEQLKLLNVVLNAWMKWIYENYLITVHFVLCGPIEPQVELLSELLVFSPKGDYAKGILIIHLSVPFIELLVKSYIQFFSVVIYKITVKQSLQIRFIKWIMTVVWFSSWTTIFLA